MLGSENWEDDFDALLHLVKEFIVAVWEVRKQKLYGDDFSASPRPEIGVLLLELGVGLVSRVNLVSHMGPCCACWCKIVFVVCVAPPTHVGAWSMALLLGQPFEYYYFAKIAKIFRYHTRSQGQDLEGKTFKIFGPVSFTIFRDFSSRVSNNYFSLTATTSPLLTLRILYIIACALSQSLAHTQHSFNTSTPKYYRQGLVLSLKRGVYCVYVVNIH